MKNTLAITPEAAKAIDAVEKMNSEWDGVGSAANLISPDEIQKFEEIKSMAEKIYLKTIHFLPSEKAFNAGELPHCFEIAKRFYDYAKEKEGKNEIHPGCWTCSLCKNWFKNNVKYYSVNMEGKYFCSKECVLKEIENDEKEKEGER